MKFAFLLQSYILTYVRTTRLSWTRLQALFGKLKNCHKDYYGQAAVYWQIECITLQIYRFNNWWFVYIFSIIMEYANNGDLFQKISRHQKEQTYLREEDIWRIFIQVVKGLKALHDTNIFHRDLKSANVFLNKDGTAKLGDMNVSKVAKRGLLYTQTGTPYYASPEVWRDQPYDMKSDIWSLGCVLYESITLRPPFRADDMAGLYRKVLRGQYSRIPDHFSNELGEVCKSMIQV